MSNWLNTFMSKAISQSGDELVSSLLNRIESSSGDDLRKSILELRQKSEDMKYIKDIGNGMPILLELLKSERKDLDVTRAILQLLINIMMNHDSETRIVSPDSLHFSFISSFVQHHENIVLILSLLEENDLSILFYSIKILTLLMISQPSKVQDIFMCSPSNIIRLIDLLKLDSEMIRNESLLLLIEITRTNIELQKVLAFEHGFEILLSIIENEGMNNGGIIVQDSLILINQLLFENTANQKYFREMGCIIRLCGLLILESADQWILTDDKKEILILALDTINSLSSNPDNKRMFASTQMVHLVSNLAFLSSPSIGLNLRVKALGTLGCLVDEDGEADESVSSAYKTISNRSQFETLLCKLELGGIQEVSAPLKCVEMLFIVSTFKEQQSFMYVLTAYLSSNPTGKALLADKLIQNVKGKHGQLGNPMMAITQELVQFQMMTKAQSSIRQGQVPRIVYCFLLLLAILTSNPIYQLRLLECPAVNLQNPEDRVVQSIGDSLFILILKVLPLILNQEIDSYIQVSMLKLLVAWLDGCQAAKQAFMSRDCSAFDILIQRARISQGDIHVIGLSTLICGMILSSTCLQPSVISISEERLRTILTNILKPLDILAKLDQLKNSPEFVSIQGQRGIKKPTNIVNELSIMKEDYYNGEVVEMICRNITRITNYLCVTPPASDLLLDISHHPNRQSYLPHMVLSPNEKEAKNCSPQTSPSLVEQYDQNHSHQRDLFYYREMPIEPHSTYIGNKGSIDDMTMPNGHQLGSNWKEKYFILLGRYKQLEAEHEDLLVLLAETENTNLELKQRLGINP